ncbi:MAG: DUF1501 domain-containing protein [Pseudomonadota bacterium]
MRPNRRAFLAGAGASAIGAASLGGVGAALNSFQAHAADVSGYKALVCVFLLGGLDNHDTLFPYDQSSYDELANIRASLFAQYSGMAGGSTRDRGRLLKLNPDNAAAFGSREFALPEELSGIHGLFEQGDAAVVANVGPLIQPLTATEFENESVPTPARLFSHNDQQSTWMSSAPEGAQFGWGGRFADAALASGANTTPDFTTITALGNELFLTGEDVIPYQVGFGGEAAMLDLLEFFDGNRSTPEGEQAYQLLRAHFESSSFTSSNLIERDIAAANAASLSTNASYNEALANAIPLATPFPDTFLGVQLSAIARTISIRNSLFVSRQVFFVAIGGFDTHSAQATDIPTLQQEIDGGVTAFFQAMQELGVASDVTLFTASDFGRTLAINGDGTDHGWGAHHFVVGEAVQGKNIYGDPPPSNFGHAQDAGGGRLIPGVSVEQFAEPLGRWFGLTDAELAVALPNLSNFTAPSLTFV